MNKLIALLFLVLAVAALTTDDAHAQAARPAQYAQNPTPAQQPRGQPQQYNPTNKFKRVGYECKWSDKDLSDNHSTIIAYILISKPLITITEK